VLQCAAVGVDGNELHLRDLLVKRAGDGAAVSVVGLAAVCVSFILLLLFCCRRRRRFLLLRDAVVIVCCYCVSGCRRGERAKL
jgi:hypothetical protein